MCIRDSLGLVGMPPADTVAQPQRYVWDVVGWVLPESAAAPLFVSEVMDAVTPGSAAAAGNPEQVKRTTPQAGGRWMELSLVFSGGVLELHRNGRLVARAPASADTATPIRVAGYGMDHVLTIGAAEIGPALITLAPSVPAPVAQVTLDARTVVDDVTLARLGTDLAQSFPSGVVPTQGYRVLVHPDGRITSLATQGGAGTAGAAISWQFQGVYAEAEDLATVEIEPTSGRVTLSKVTPSRSAQ